MNIGMQGVSSLIQSLIGEVRDASVALATFSSELKIVRENVTALMKIVRDGGEHEPLMTKVALIEQSLEELEGVTIRAMSADIDKINGKLVDAIDAKTALVEDKKDRREGRGQRLQVWGLIIAGLVTLASAAIALLK